MPISTIGIDVDQATFDNWSQAMGNLAQTFTVPITVVNPIPAIAIPPTLSFTGIDLLNEVGHATTRPDVIDDPDRLFALFRYGTKVSAQTPNFRLNHHRPLRDIHKSSVLSDEIGAGFALLFGSRVVGASLFLDLRDAVRRGRIMPAAPKSTVPDYIGLYGPSNSVLVLPNSKRMHPGRFRFSSSREISFESGGWHRTAQR